MFCELTLLSLIDWEATESWLLDRLVEKKISKAHYYRFVKIRKIVHKMMQVGHGDIPTNDLDLVQEVYRYVEALRK